MRTLNSLIFLHLTQLDHVGHAGLGNGHAREVNHEIPFGYDPHFCQLKLDVRYGVIRAHHFLVREMP